jgi:antitoxin MazE
MNVVSKAKIVKWGNGLAALIPKDVAEELRLKAGDSVMIDASEGRVDLRRVVPTLEELVAGITPENCHGEIDWGPDVSKEIVE